MLVSLVLLGANRAAAEPPPAKEKSAAKEPPATFRAYLPTIRLKALLDNERQSVADLQTWLRIYEVYLVGGLVNLVQRGQLEEGLHRSRLRVLRLETDYRDSLDQFTRRFRISEKLRRQMEESVTSPLTKIFRGFEVLPRDHNAAISDLNGMEDLKAVPNLRLGLIKILTESALVKNTTLPKRFLKRWDEWKKIEDKKKLFERILKIRKDLTQLRERETELLEKQQELPEVDRQRREALTFERDVGEFQLGLILYEKQPWKDIKDDAKRLKRRGEMFNGLHRIVLTILDHAYSERLHRLNQSWPGLAPVKVKDVDLLACKWDTAAGTIASLLKTPDKELAGKKKVRHLRSLAESYPIQKRLFQLAFMEREELKKEPLGSPPAPDLILPGIKGLVGPTGPRPIVDDHPYAPGSILKREAAIKRARRQLLQTWIDYQMLRLDFYGDLGLSAPER
ncbi:MAG: hypothetical protein ACRELG_11760 [Gemmataceae bacterium]